MRMLRYLQSLLVVVAVFSSGAFAESSMRAIDDAIAATDYQLALNLIDKHLVATPDDASLLVRRARVQGYVGDHDGALVTLSTLRQRHPNDVDYALARAQTLVRQGRDEDALDELRQAAILAPGYEDVLRLQYTVLSRQGDDGARREREALVQEAATRFPDARWWQSEAIVDSAEWTIIVGASRENLDNGLPAWSQQFVEISREQDGWGRYRIGLARDKRFENSDLAVSLGGDFFFASGWSAGLDIAFVDRPNFQPDLGYSGYVSRSLQEGWVVNLRYRRREYESATVSAAISTIEKYIGDFRFAYALGVSRLHGASNSLNHGLTMNWYYNDRSSIGVNLNAGEETEAIGVGQVLQTDVRGMSLVGKRRLSGRYSVQWWLGVHDQGNYYRRTYLGMALTLRL